MPEIWVLGSTHANAHKSIAWSSPFPNFSNADILIVNLQSLSTQVCYNIRSALYNEARRYIFDMLMTGEKTVIIILSEKDDILQWLPIYPTVKSTASVKLSEFTEELKIATYLKMVEDCSYYVHSYNCEYFIGKTNPKSSWSENYFFTPLAEEKYSYNIVIDYEIKNVAKQAIGAAARFKIYYGYTVSHTWKGNYVSGPIVFLPPPTKATPEEAIDVLINSYVHGISIEPPPRWEQEINLPGINELENQIAQKEKEVKLLTKEITNLKGKMDDITKLRKLLWTDNGSLENAVKDAFIILGFSEIRKIRPPNLEDWIIDFKQNSKFKHGVFEIKGAEKRTSLADLTQCNKWVEDYLLENTKVKGIFVPNQNRREDVRKRKQEFAPNEIDYAQKREICILPTEEIFNAVVEKLKGNKRLTREYIEEKITSTNGICKLI